MDNHWVNGIKLTKPLEIPPTTSIVYRPIIWIESVRKNNMCQKKTESRNEEAININATPDIYLHEANL